MAGIVGVDVAKAEHAVYSNGRCRKLKNTRPDLVQFVRELPPESTIGLEATGRFGWTLADLAYAGGHTVFMVNPRKVKKYRESITDRAKTDPIDAEIVASYIEQHQAKLHQYVTPPAWLRDLRDLLTDRHAQVVDRLRNRARWKELGLRTAGQTALLKAQALLVEERDRRIHELAKDKACYRPVLSIKGVGKITAAACVCLYERFDFKNENAVVAYVGLDLRVRDSGQKKGTKYLSNNGDASLRTLLYMCAMSASQTADWKPYYEKKLADLGGCKTKALVALARKLLKLTYHLAKTGRLYDRNFAKKKQAAAPKPLDMQP